MVRGRRRNSQLSGGTAAITALDAAALPENGSSARAKARVPPRRLGVRTAQHKAQKLLAGQGDLPPYKQAVLGLVGRLLTHAENISNGLYYRTEFLPDG